MPQETSCETLLTGLWSRRLRPCEPPMSRGPAGRRRIALPADTVYLAGAQPGASGVFRAGSELEPGLSLADVLAEELDLFVSDSTLVVIAEGANGWTRAEDRAPTLRDASPEGGPYLPLSRPVPAHVHQR